MSTVEPHQSHPRSQATTVYYRDRAKTWQASAKAVPSGAPQQAIYREIAEGYEKLAAHYERREQLERPKAAVPEVEAI